MDRKIPKEDPRSDSPISNSLTCHNRNAVIPEQNVMKIKRLI